MKEKKGRSKSNKKTKLIKSMNWIRKSKIINKKVIRLLILIMIILFITNPSLIPFLPKQVKDPMAKAWRGMFGEVSQISDVVPFNWIIIFQLIIMVLMLIMIMTIIKAVLISIKPKSKRKSTLITLLLSTFHYLSVIAGIIWALIIFGIDPATIFASIGIVSAVIGFSSDSLIADIMTGLFLLFDNQYNVGDIIEVEGFRGTVSKIGIRTTSIEDSGNNVKIINSSDMRNIINRSAMISKAICDITIPLKKDILAIEKKLDKLLIDIQSKYPEILYGEPRYLGVQSLDKEDMVIRFTVSAKEQDIFMAKRIMNHEIKIEFQKMGIWD